MGPIIVTVFRLIIPISILRWPLGGVIASTIADALDVVVAGAIGLGEFADYTSADKLLDSYLLTFMAISAFRWENRIARYTCLALFGYRMVGVALLLLTQQRWLLFVFPNVIEFFWLYHVVTARWFSRFEVRDIRRLALVLVILIGLKLPQEYLLHVMGFGPWHWFHTEVLGIESKVNP